MNQQDIVKKILLKKSKFFVVKYNTTIYNGSVFEDVVCFLTKLDAENFVEEIKNQI